MGSRTIAEDVIACAANSAFGRRTFGRISDALLPPWEGNHVPLVHPAVGELLADDIKGRYTPIYSFDAGACGAVEALVSLRNPQRRALAIEMAQPPADRFWFELKNYALYAEKTEGGLVVDLICRLSTCDIPILWTQFDFSYIDLSAAHKAHQTYYYEVRRYKHFGNVTPRFDDLEDLLALKLAALCAFLAVGGATVTVPERRPVKVGRGAAQKTIGFLTVGKTRLALPAGCAVRASGERRGPGVRFHDVRGHYREVSVGGQKMLRFIAAFWRGNPRLGIVVKPRQVTT